MELDADRCYRALQAHDARFDGVFFVGVSSTGVYCRPICPARVPAASRCTFFPHAAGAERAGYRACFRCRPELAPGSSAAPASVDAVATLARQAAQHIEAGYLNERSLDELAVELGVSTRHVRRAVQAELGVSPLELAQTQRLALAKRLLQDTRLPLAEVAFASGFSSVRRFNGSFRERFGRAPSSVRHDHAEAALTGSSVTLRLDYRPPFAWQALLDFLASRAIAGVEHIEGGTYRRSVQLQGQRGWVQVSAHHKRHALIAQVSLSLLPVLGAVVARLRLLFDLDAQPAVVAAHLRQDPLLAPLLAAQPGLRVPGAFDGFEMAVRAILGQQVTVRGATTLCGRLVQRFGERMSDDPHIGFGFPPAERLAAASLDTIAALGMPGARARSILALSRAVAEEPSLLSSSSSPEQTIERVQSLEGIGPWTAHYLALRALHWPNAFPASDLGVRKALGMPSARGAEERARGWQPWRAYAVLHLWSSLTPSHTEHRG